jgi:hypothetical protein
VFRTAYLDKPNYFMGLSYYYTLTAPATASAEELTLFLKRVEKEAQRMGFRPTLVLNANFDTQERRQFARRLTTGFPIQDERLKNVSLPASAAVWEHDPHNGTCHLLPTNGVVLVVTDEQGCETLFGFFQYEERLTDIHGRPLAEIGLKGRWHCSQFVDSPDARFREIVRLFNNDGFLESENDEFHTRLG